MVHFRETCARTLEGTLSDSEQSAGSSGSNVRSGGVGGPIAPHMLPMLQARALKQYAAPGFRLDLVHRVFLSVLEAIAHPTSSAGSPASSGPPASATSFHCSSKQVTCVGACTVREEGGNAKSSVIEFGWARTNTIETGGMVFVSAELIRLACGGWSMARVVAHDARRGARREHGAKKLVQSRCTPQHLSPTHKGMRAVRAKRTKEGRPADMAEPGATYIHTVTRGASERRVGTRARGTEREFAQKKMVSTSASPSTRPSSQVAPLTCTQWLLIGRLPSACLYPQRSP